MRVHGSCHCGSIRYEADVDPEKTMICHCSDCQALSSTAFRVNVPAKTEDFHLLQGQPKEYVKIGDSGGRRAQGFCPDCGSSRGPSTCCAPAPSPNATSWSQKARPGAVLH